MTVNEIKFEVIMMVHKCGDGVAERYQSRSILEKGKPYKNEELLPSVYKLNWGSKLGRIFCILK